MLITISCGCKSKPVVAPVTQPMIEGLAPLEYMEALHARVPVPEGWIMDRDEHRSGYAQRVWVSPTKKTALGVIRFDMPLPVGHSGALWGFMREMRRAEGSAELLERDWDDQVDALRFVAEGGRYIVHAILRVRGFDGLLVYAGITVAEGLDEAEFDLAKAARERTLWGDGR